MTQKQEDQLKCLVTQLNIQQKVINILLPEVPHSVYDTLVNVKISLYSISVELESITTQL
jgi:hypothetical protein